MTQITVSDELARQIAGAAPPIVIVVGRGRRLGEIQQCQTADSVPDGLSREEWNEILRRTRSASEYSTLEEIKRRHGRLPQS